MWGKPSGGTTVGGGRPGDAPSEIDLSRAAAFEIGKLAVQPSTLQVDIDGRTSTLEPRVMQVLVVLAENRGQVVSRDLLVERCWSGRAVSEDAINRCIAKVRRLASECLQFDIETIPRVGYRLHPSNAPSRTANGRRFRWSVPLALAVLAILLAGTGTLYWRTPRQPQQPIVAVLPFTRLNADSDTIELGETVTAAVANALAQTGIRLPADLRTVEQARASGAALIISGTVRREGSTLRITAQVDSANKRSTILTNEFEGSFADAPLLTGRVAEWLVPPVRMWSSFLPIEEDSATTDEILRIFLTRAIGDGLRTWELSRSLAEAKPDSGAAQYVFALLTSEIVGDLPQEQRPAAVASARRAATRAAALLPNPGRALAVLDCNLEPPGLLVVTPKCDRRVREEIAQDPNVPLLPYLFGWQLLEAGRFREAGTMADMDLAQDPLGPGQLALRIFAGRSTSSGNEDLELPKLEARVERYLGSASMVQFDYKVAISNGEIDAAKALLENPAEGSEIASGRTKTVIELVMRALKSRSSSDIAAMHAGCSPPPPANPPDAPAFGTCLVGLTMLNDLDSAFALADRGYDDLDCCSPQQQEDRWLASGGGFYPRYELFGKATAPMRADRRFIEVARRTGLLAYWKSGHPPDFCAVERVPVCGALRSGETTGR